MWRTACLESARPLVQSPVLPSKTNKIKILRNQFKGRGEKSIYWHPQSSTERNWRRHK
jgi:hypothetical protein